MHFPRKRSKAAIYFNYKFSFFLLQEQHETEEENLYKLYVEKARDRYDEYNQRGGSLNRLALQALNAVHVVSQEEGETKVAFV